MNWKTVLSIVIIIAIVGLILFSPKGQKYHGNYTSKYTKPLGSFLSGLTSKVTRPRNTDLNDQGKLEVELKNVQISDLRDVELSARNSNLECTMESEIINFLNTEVQSSDNIIDLEVSDLVGEVAFFTNGKIKITGKTRSFKLDDLFFNKAGTEIMFVGKPISFSLNNIDENKMTFPSISGSLSWAGLGDVPARLKNDHLEFKNFKGKVVQENDALTVRGYVDSIRLNGVDISKS